MEEVCQLRTLVNNLRELITLHRKYNCKLALSDFEKVGESLDLPELFYHSQHGYSLHLCHLYFDIQEDTTTIVFRMFDKVLAPELIPSIFQKFIRVYVHEHDLQEEELLLLYIEVTSFFLDLCSVSSYWMFNSEECGYPPLGSVQHIMLLRMWVNSAANWVVTLTQWDNIKTFSKWLLWNNTSMNKVFCAM